MQMNEEVRTGRELKQRQRRRKRERHKFAYLVGKNNSLARSARAFFTFVHFSLCRRLQNDGSRGGAVVRALASHQFDPCHTAAILSRETKKALFYHAKPHPHGFHCEAWRGKTKLFWSPNMAAV